MSINPSLIMDSIQSHAQRWNRATELQDKLCTSPSNSSIGKHVMVYWRMGRPSNKAFISICVDVAWKRRKRKDKTHWEAVIAWVSESSTSRLQNSSRIFAINSNQAELLAIWKALKETPEEYGNVIIKSDSVVAIEAIQSPNKAAEELKSVAKDIIQQSMTRDFVSCIKVQRLNVSKAHDLAASRRSHGYEDVQTHGLLQFAADQVTDPYAQFEVEQSTDFDGSNKIDKDSYDVFTFINWESLFNFPKHVAFKGDNGKYLGAFEQKGIQYLSFSYDDLEDPKVSHELFKTHDGTLCIKSNHLGKFWRLGDRDWIVVDADDPRNTTNTAAMFRAVVRDVNVVALLNMYKTWFCKRFTTGKENFLNAATQNIDECAILMIIDLGGDLSSNTCTK
uniref:Agglutinin domain-containing protein n=1 Tax=Chenopodium quinoa TaxID=63459 RepID=A0A803LNT4_CHEQI